MLSLLMLFSSSTEAKTYKVTTTDNDGVGTLRNALIQAHNAGDSATIEFELTSEDAGYDCRSKSWCIQLTEPLPVIGVRVTIDGYSQAGSSKNRAAIDQENNAHIAVELCCGAAADVASDDGCPAVGLTFGPGSDCSTIRGLAINGFEKAIVVQANNVHINGMFLGVGIDGKSSHPNTSSIVIDAAAAGTVIGGCKPKYRNLIGGSSQGEGFALGADVQLLGAITNLGNHTTIQGTTINLTRKGDALVTTEAQRGIVSRSNNGMLVGGPLTEQRVVVAGNYDANIHLDSTSNDLLQNVFAGLAINGKHALGGGAGLRMINNQGEPAPAALGEGYTHAIMQSVFSGHRESGLVLGHDDSAFAVDNTLIRASFVGTDVTGVHKVPNDEHGIESVWATNTVIEDSVLSHNGGNGIYQTTGTTILANVNTSYNRRGGINLPCGGARAAQGGCPSGDDMTAPDGGCAFRLKRVKSIENGNNAIGSPHFTIEQL
jgi:hypothetical protein